MNGEIPRENEYNEELIQPAEEKTEEQFREGQAEKAGEFLKHIQAYDYFKDILSGEKKLPEFKDFEDFIVRLNGIIRDIPIADRSTDGENVYLDGFLEQDFVPKHSDKEELLRHAYDSISDIKKTDIKYMISAVVNSVHLFADGNGRTSRILHQLLSEHASEEEFLSETQKALGKYGRFESADINTELINFELKREVLKKHDWNFDDLTAPEGKLDNKNFRFTSLEAHNMSNDENIVLPKEVKEFFDLEEKNKHYAVTAIYMLLGERIEELFTDKYKRENEISPLKMVEVLTTEEWHNLVDNMYELKKEQVEDLVKIFKNPKGYETEDGKMTLKDLFIEKIQKRKEENEY